MEVYNGLQDRVFYMDEKQFEAVALEVFRYQADYNLVYREFIRYLDIQVADITAVSDIPFLPIEIFKSRKVVTEEWDPELIFTSSGTGQTEKSKHYLRKSTYYERVSLKIFEGFYGSPDRYHVLALLPSYLERSGSSLVHMLNHFITKSGSESSGFYLRDFHRLQDRIKDLESETDRTIMLWGVSFALLDLAEAVKIDLSNAIVLETGGMKGQREEIIRDDLHERLRSSFGCHEIQSEYGMAELTSQAYTVNGRFRTPVWMRVIIRDISDPFDYLSPGRVGGINIIDLANIHSCAFIETQDLGELGPDGSFKVMGRLDNSDVRGCNLLLE